MTVEEWAELELELQLQLQLNENRSFEKLNTIGNIVFYLDENGIKRMATKERFKEILKEKSI